MSPNKNSQIAKNTIFLYIRLVFILFVSLYTTQVVLNSLGIMDYGIYNVVAGFVSMFSFLNASMSSCTQRFYNFKKGKEDNMGMMDVFNTSLCIQAIIVIICFVLLESFGLWYINHKMVIPPERLTAANWLFQFSVFNLLIVIIQIPFVGAIIANEKMDYYALVGIIDVLAKLAIVLILPHVNADKLIFYGSLILITGIINLLMYGIYAKIKFDFIKLSYRFNKSLFKEMFRFTGWTIFDTIAYIFKGQGINVLLNAFCGPVINAARGIAYQITNALSSFQSNVIVAFKPQLIQSYAEKNYNRVNRLLYSSSKISYILLATFVIPIIIELEYILNLWLKGIVPEYTIPFTVIILIDMVVSSLNTPISVTIQATGRIRNYQVIRSLITLSVLPISWICMKYLSNPNIVFIVSFIITIIIQPISMMLLHKVFPYSYKEYTVKVIFPCLIFSLIVPIFPFILKQIMTEGLIRLSIITIISLIISLCISWLLVLDTNERIILRKFISRK